MRVLMVHDESIAVGYGAESYVRRLVAGLRAGGDDVEVVAGEIRHTGIGRWRDLWDPAARSLVSERCQRFQPDVVHFHNIARELSPSVLRAAPDVPAVMTVHDLRLLGAAEHSWLSMRGWGERAVGRGIRRAASQRLAATIGVSERVTDSLREHRFTNVSTVPVPAAQPVSDPTAVSECRDIAVIARLAKDKGVDVAIDGFLAASDQRPDSRLLIAGDGPERSRLEHQAAGHDRVSFLGRLDEPEVSALLGQVRAVVVASQPRHRPEGSSMTLVEAGMHGRPVVASTDPAVTEVAGQLGNALLVAGRDVEGYASALGRLLDDDGLATRLGEQGHANATRLHSIDAVTAATREVYRAVTGVAA